MFITSFLNFVYIRPKDAEDANRAEVIKTFNSCRSGRDKQKYRKDGGAMESRENVNAKSKGKLEIFRKKSREKENEMNCNQFQSAQVEVGQWSPGQVGPHWGT